MPLPWNQQKPTVVRSLSTYFWIYSKTVHQSTKQKIMVFQNFEYGSKSVILTIWLYGYKYGSRVKMSCPLCHTHFHSEFCRRLGSSIKWDMPILIHPEADRIFEIFKTLPIVMRMFWNCHILLQDDYVYIYT